MYKCMRMSACMLMWQACAMQVGKSFAKGLDDAMAKCISDGGTATSCCSVVRQVTTTY